MVNLYFEPFIIPFVVGVVTLFAIIWSRFISWISSLPIEDKKLIIRNCLTVATIKALWEAFRECLLHLRILRVHPRLWYMHMSLAFGWFLLIVVGKIEGTIYLGSPMNPPYVDVFFRRYFPNAHIPLLGFLMDLILLFVLSGLYMAFMKRVKLNRYGMKRATKHTLGDRVALATLWAIFPVRLLAESFNSAVFDSGSFLTGTIGAGLAFIIPEQANIIINIILWWTYSIVLGAFFVSVPFSRYLHIFAEIPLIFLRNYGVRAKAPETTFTNLEIAACSRCGVCIDVCQLGNASLSHDIQSAYFLRDVRQGKICKDIADNCLMCGRCENICPVAIETNTIRLSQRAKLRTNDLKPQYNYINIQKTEVKSSKVGYFSGCMGKLTPAVIQSMTKIFDAANEDYIHIDSSEGICCGRPQRLSGNIDAANTMMQANIEMITLHGVDTLVTSCPICLKSFKEDYNLPNIRVIHHTQYIDELIKEGRIATDKSDVEKYTYHDPCELGRGCGIYEEPRRVIENIGTLLEASDNRKNGHCCGGSLANTFIAPDKKLRITSRVTDMLEKTGAENIVTSCPMCKKSLAKTSNVKVVDISEIVAKKLVMS